MSFVCVFLSTGGEEEYNGESDGAVQKGWPVISGNRELCCPYRVHGFWLCQISKAVLRTVFMSRSLAEIIYLVVGSWWCFHYYTVLFGSGFQVLLSLLHTYCDPLVPGGTVSWVICVWFLLCDWGSAVWYKSHETEHDGSLCGLILVLHKAVIMSETSAAQSCHCYVRD